MYRGGLLHFNSKGKAAMSYSLSVSGETKDEVKQKLAESFDAMIAGQPTHAKDRDAALAAAGALVDLLDEPAPDQEYQVSIYGSLSWQGLNPTVFVGASLSTTAGFRVKPAE